METGYSKKRKGPYSTAHTTEPNFNHVDISYEIFLNLYLILGNSASLGLLLAHPML